MDANTDLLQKLTHAEAVIMELRGVVVELQIGGNGGLKTASVLLSVCASATRHRLNPWAYLRDVLDQFAARSAGAKVVDLLPDA